jgi:methane monooxygenase PmoA-like
MPGDPLYYVMITTALLLLQAVAERTPDAVLVKEGAVEILRYQLTKPPGTKLSVESACYFHPLTTPKGVVVTDVAPDDHLHHRGIFLAWVEMHGKKDADFWGWGEKAPKKDRRIVNREVTDLKGGSFRVRNEWLAEESVMLSEELAVSIRTQGDARILDLGYALTADEEVQVSQWAFSGFCARARKDGKTVIEGPDGVVNRPTPSHLDPKTAWPDARWYACSFELPDGRKAGVAVINPASNPKAGWYNAKSIAMLNPSVTAPGPLTLAPKAPLKLSYRVVAYDGPTPRDLLNDLAK